MYVRLAYHVDIQEYLVTGQNGSFRFSTEGEEEIKKVNPNPKRFKWAYNDVLYLTLF